MRDTSDMMEDASSEDTMMDCEGDGGGTEDLVKFTSDVADSSSTIRDVAERLLRWLPKDDENEDLTLSSEDEGVDLDEDELEDEEEELENARLLCQLATSLAAELKQSQQKQTRIPARSSFDDQMELTGTGYLERGRPQEEQNIKGTGCCRENVADKCQIQDSSSYTYDKGHVFVDPYQCLDARLRTDQRAEASSQVLASWSAGWDACSTETLRYLVEVEGLSPHDPTVLDMKNFLERQRERAFAHYTT